MWLASPLMVDWYCLVSWVAASRNAWMRCAHSRHLSMTGSAMTRALLRKRVRFPRSCGCMHDHCPGVASVDRHLREYSKLDAPKHTARSGPAFIPVPRRTIRRCISLQRATGDGGNAATAYRSIRGPAKLPLEMLHHSQAPFRPRNADDRATTAKRRYVRDSHAARPIAAALTVWRPPRARTTGPTTRPEPHGPLHHQRVRRAHSCRQAASTRR